MSQRLSKIIVVLLILSAATAIWIPRQRTLSEARAALLEAKTQQLKLAEHIDTATTELASVRSELHAQNTARNQARAAIKKAEAELIKVDPEALWSTPPTSLPDWNSQSPYVWLRKDTLPKLPVKAFTETGALNDEVAAVLTLTETQKAELNTALANTIAEYRALETAKAEKSDEHLPGIAGTDGEKFTIVVHPQPEDGERLRQQFETALRNELGPQRADLVLQTASNWLDEQFSQSGAQPKTISLLRHPDGTYNLSIKSGASDWFSTGGPWQLINRHIPPHLRNLFTDFIQPQPQPPPQ